MNALRSFRLARSGVVLLMTLSVPLAFSGRLRDLAPPIGVRVNGHTRFLPPDTTLADVIARFRLRPRSGDLVDVDGGVLRARFYPGSVRLDGREPLGNPALHDRDTVVVVNGKDHREPVQRTVTRIPGGRPGNPQFFLGTAPGDLVTTTGKLSGKVVSSIFRPSGPASRPPAVALTFDDGPGPYTARVLHVLELYHVPATFFVIGYMAAANPDMVRAEARAGMSIGNHSWDHPNTIPFRDLSTAQMDQEVGKTSRLLASLGIPTSLFRPPGGSSSPAVVREASHYDSRVILWDVDPKDWVRGRTTAQIVQTVMANVHPGSIVALHDAGGDRSATIAALPAIIRGIRARHLELVALS